MAKRSSRGGGRGAAAKPRGRQPKATSKKRSTAAAVEVVEESDGMGVDAGIAIVTTVLLVAAFLFVDAHLGHYDGGIFFK